MEKSHVGMEHQVCIVCGRKFSTGNILLDTRLRKSMPENPVTGYGVCPDDDSKYKEGYIALVEASAPEWQRGVLKPDEANRTGRIAHVRREAFTRIFNVPLPIHEKTGEPLVMVFIEPGVIEKLESLTQQEGDDNDVTNPG